MELSHHLAPHILDQLDENKRNQLRGKYVEMNRGNTDHRIRCENEIRGLLEQWLGPLQ